MTETEIKDALDALLNSIKAGDRQVIATQMDRLDALVDGAGAGLHPQLLHFLRNRSYAKAVIFLGGEANPPAGACGGGAARN